MCALAPLALALAGCAAPRDPADWVTIREITPAFLGLGSSDATLASDRHGRVALTFVSRDATGKNLWLAVSRDSGLTFGAPVRVNLREGRVDSYPESRPAVTFGPSGQLAVAWSERRDAGDAVDLVVRASGDAGTTLGVPAIVNDDRTPPPAWRKLSRQRWVKRGASGYHGFPGLAFLPDGSLFAAWLDGRDDWSGEPEPPYAAIYSATSPDGGQSWKANTLLADSICSCCRIDAATDASGRLALSYRSARSDFRDPALAVSRDRGRTFPLDTVVSADRWRLQACPSQGPVIAWSHDEGGWMAWYTGASPAGVYLMPWHLDHGAAGLSRPLSDSLERARSPRLATWDGATFVAVEARPASDTSRTVLAVRSLDPDGSLTPWSFLGAQARAGSIAATGPRTVLACWTEREGDRTRVRVARLKRRSGPA